MSLILYITCSFEASQKMADLYLRRKLNRKKGVGALNSEALRSDRVPQKGNWGAVASAFEEGMMLNLEM